VPGAAEEARSRRALCSFGLPTRPPRRTASWSRPSHDSTVRPGRVLVPDDRADGGRGEGPRHRAGEAHASGNGPLNPSGRASAMQRFPFVALLASACWPVAGGVADAQYHGADADRARRRWADGRHLGRADPHDRAHRPAGELVHPRPHRVQGHPGRGHRPVRRGVRGPVRSARGERQLGQGGAGDDPWGRPSPTPRRRGWPRGRAASPRPARPGPPRPGRSGSGARCGPAGWSSADAGRCLRPPVAGLVRADHVPTARPGRTAGGRTSASSGATTSASRTSAPTRWD
jgi:hypothetical protein